MTDFRFECALPNGRRLFALWVQPFGKRWHVGVYLGRKDELAVSWMYPTRKEPEWMR